VATSCGLVGIGRQVVGVDAGMSVVVEWCPRPMMELRCSSGLYFFASRAVVEVTSLATGATRAPAFCDGIHAVAKRGQMTGGCGESLDHDILRFKLELRRFRQLG